MRFFQLPAVIWSELSLIGCEHQLDSSLDTKICEIAITGYGRDTVGGAHHHFLKLFYEDLSGRRLLTASVNQLQLIQTMPGPTQRAGMLCFQLSALELRLRPTSFWRSHGGIAFQVEDLVCCRRYTLNRTRQVWETSTTGSDSTTGEKHGMLIAWLSRAYRVG